MSAQLAKAQASVRRVRRNFDVDGAACPLLRLGHSGFDTGVIQWHPCTPIARAGAKSQELTRHRSRRRARNTKSLRRFLSHSFFLRF